MLSPTNASAGETMTLVEGDGGDPCPADLDGDGTIGPFDLAFVLGAWGPNRGHPADLNGDDIVDASDLAIVLGAWGPCP